MTREDYIWAAFILNHRANTDEWGGYVYGTNPEDSRSLVRKRTLGLDMSKNMGLVFSSQSVDLLRTNIAKHLAALSQGGDASCINPRRHL